MDTSIVVYEITLKRQESLVNISQTILVFYRYEIVNESDGELILFHHNVEVMRLEPKIRRQVYYYKSNSEWFRIARYDREEGKLLFSDLFRINEPRQFIVPVPKELHKQKNCVYPYETNYLYTVRTSEAEDMLFIRIVNTDITRCPVYFQNSTSYNVRIFEGIQDFTIPSGDKIPFFFTNLDFKKGNELMIEVEGVRKIVRMNEVSDMESIGLDDFRIGRRPQINKSFKRGRLGILFNEFHGDYNVVVDVLIQELRIYDQTWRVLQRVSLRHASFIDSEGNKIYIFLPDNDQLLITIKNHAESAAWKEILGDCLAVRTGRRIFLTVDSNRNSRIIKLQETSSEDIRSIRKLDIEVFVKNLSLAMISGYPA
ncbi:MAG: hypothetical protein JST59_00980 [Actinobacteria bacterium]|nr:hypothetical protein [Actinomycetota bacterium]